ncbi:FecCD family ABC transporter permease [Dysosmobacter sp.]|uniref:FecCD family ABC transporter permease n=1 Tax=Dysosmobacter sp. TaxID=2591382 RepID=UPI002A9A5C91|nr:iron ABC transporter permease [Dysosmobacter sp.]MCI6054165.1 iron ABC transporter permease [Dysosmobacter sp.]MDY5510936.1 iron ABC transporter permease [Dysosmobacter sp.]
MGRERTMPAAYGRLLRRRWLTLAVLALLVGALVLVSLTTGSSALTAGDLLEALLGRGTDQTRAILFRVRLPRTAAAAVVGAALALSGCVMQCVLRNPLASASTLGVSQGAAFGAAAAIIGLDAGVQNAANAASAVTISSPAAVTVCAFLGGMATTVFVLALSRLRGAAPSSMILAGVALSSLFTGGTTLLQYFADDVQVATVVYWTFGDLGRPGWSEIGLIAACTAAALLFFLRNRWNYNALSGGGDTARSLGVNVGVLTCASMALCTLIAAVSVAFVGVVSFVGLVAPHMLRRFTGADHRFLIPASALGGAALLLLGDLAARELLSPAVLPIGAITSFLGAPMFLYLLFRRRDRLC